MRKKPTNLLLIEDNPEQAMMIQKVLKETTVEGIDFDIKWANTISRGLEYLLAGETEVVLLDVTLPDSWGLAAFASVYAHIPIVPIIVLGGLNGEAVAVKEVLRRDAQDYLIKGQAGSDLLVRAIHYAIERKKAEQKLKETIVEKSQFVSVVSHELRTPLAAIKEGICLVLNEVTGKLNVEQKGFLDIAKRNVDRLAGLINDILDFQKLEIGKMAFNMRENDINEIVREIKETMVFLAKKKGLKLITRFDDTVPMVKFDRDMIARVLINIVGNAIKFTDKGNITITTAKDDNVIRVSVQDGGPGIKEEYLPKLFREFEQLPIGKDGKMEGTGLGLAICRDVIQKHNGKIWAESEPGKGTVFHFILPIKERRGKRGN